MQPRFFHSANSLRRELSARNVAHAADRPHELTFGGTPSVIYACDDEGTHGNFLAASYERICSRPEWQRRLEKAYTASARVPRSQDRQRKELDCASSSDALLMNVFCYPRVLCRPGVCGLLGIESGLLPAFGVRAHLAMRKDEIDRTELDMTLGDLLVEAKLTETGFQTASFDRVNRYLLLSEVFDVEELPRSARGVEGYQLIRGVLSAYASGGRFALLYDRRRADLEEIWFRVLCAMRSSSLRSRMVLVSWQELAAVMPVSVQRFLGQKYGVLPQG